MSEADAKVLEAEIGVLLKRAARARPAAAPAPSARSGFLNRGGGSGLFGAAEAAPAPTSEADKILLRLKAAVSGGGGGGSSAGVAIDGVFQKLLDPAHFQRTVFPGLSEAQRAGCPRSFRELLEEPGYGRALELEAVPEALAKARCGRQRQAIKGREGGGGG